MKALQIAVLLTIIFCSFGSGCKKDSYHEKIKFVNNSNQNVVLTQFGTGLKDQSDTTYELICGLNKLGVIPAMGSILHLEGEVNSVEDKLRGGRVFPYYIVDPDSFPQGEISCDSFDFNAKFLKKIEPNLEALEASDFTYYYP